MKWLFFIIILLAISSVFAHGEIDDGHDEKRHGSNNALLIGNITLTYTNLYWMIPVLIILVGGLNYWYFKKR